MTLYWPDKDPQEVKSYEVDYNALLGADTIASSSWAVDVAGLTLTPTFTGVYARVTISGGAAGTIYTLTNTITTAAGMTVEQPVRLSVVEKTASQPTDAPTYGTMAGWISYAAARGSEIADNAANRAALIRAGDYIRTRYAVRIEDPDSIASVLAEAAYIAAGLEAGTPNLFSGTYTPAQQKVLTEVKGIKWQVVGGADRRLSAMDQQAVCPLIEGLLSPYMTSDITAVMVV